MGLGLLESIYVACLCYELTKRGLKVFTEVTLPLLKLCDKRLGFLVNFNVPLLKDGFKRFVNNF